MAGCCSGGGGTSSWTGTLAAQEGYQHQTFKDKNKRLYDFSIEISPGNSRRKSKTWLGSRMSIGVGGCDDNSTGRLLGR